MTVEEVKPKLKMAMPSALHYTSTACQHAKHAECRQTCKFCNAPCACPCHDEAKA
jgi:hypothetical protein